MHSIAVAGHLCLDLSPRLPDITRIQPGQLVEVGPLQVSLGGSVANTGTALADLGAHVTPFATVGDDDLATTLASKLSDKGFAEPQLTVSRDLSTSYSIVLEPPSADRTFWHHTGANAAFDGTAVELSGASILHVGYPNLLPATLLNDGQPLHKLLARARAAGVTTSLDLAVVDPSSTVGRLDWAAILDGAFAHADIVSPSLDDLTSALGISEPYSEELVDGLIDRMLAAGAAVVAVSAGRHGLRVRSATAARLRAGGAALAPLADAWADADLLVSPHEVPSPRTTNGAGDASTAGLLFGLAIGVSLAEAAALARAAAAAVISGARPTPENVATIDPDLTKLFGGADLP